MKLFEILAHPQSYEQAGKPAQYKQGTVPTTKMMSAEQIIRTVKNVPYYNNVVDDYDAKDFSWPVTAKVLEYAQYLKSNPSTIKNLPPIIVVDGGLQDGAHRISAIWLLRQRLDPTNLLWKDNILKVEFVKGSNIVSH